MVNQVMWNPWHGCHKISEGCLNCWMHNMDASYGRDGNVVSLSDNQILLMQKRSRDGSYKVPTGSLVFTGFSTDFFIEEADQWRHMAWSSIRLRRDCVFIILTKRPHRIKECLPDDWGDSGYPNVALAVSCENQKWTDIRVPQVMDIPCGSHIMYCAPLLECIDLSEPLKLGIDEIHVGGENSYNARPCRYEWVYEMYEQCRTVGSAKFEFWSTGSNFWKDGKQYIIRKKSVQLDQAQRSGLYVKPLLFK